MKFALRGIGTMVASQQNAWFHAAATLVVVAAGLIVGLPASSWAWIVLAIGSVWTAEALNTAFEFLTDVASPDFHPLRREGQGCGGWRGSPRSYWCVAIGGLVFWPTVAGLLK